MTRLPIRILVAGALATLPLPSAVSADGGSGHLCASNPAFVSFLHRELLGREAGAEEGERLVAALRAGFPRQEAIREVLRSDAYRRRERSGTDFVSDVFAVTLERPPDSSESGHWIPLAARVSAEGLVDGVLASPPFSRRIAACRAE